MGAGRGVAKKNGKKGGGLAAHERAILNIKTLPMNISKSFTTC